MTVALLACRRVTSEVYSVSENRSWKYRVVDIHVFICGAPWRLDSVKDALEGAEGLLEGLLFGSNKQHNWDDDSGLSKVFPLLPEAPISAISTTICDRI